MNLSNFVKYEKKRATANVGSPIVAIYKHGNITFSPACNREANFPKNLYAEYYYNQMTKQIVLVLYETADYNRYKMHLFKDGRIQFSAKGFLKEHNILPKQVVYADFIKRDNCIDAKFRDIWMTKIILCPKCKKPTLRNATNVSGWLAPDLYECSDNDCSYIGRVYIEVDPNDFKLDDEIEFDKIEKE